MPKESYYAVARGRAIGIFPTWDDCKSQVDKFPNARYKKFNDKSSAEAFIEQYKDISKSAVVGSAAIGTPTFTCTLNTVTVAGMEVLPPTKKPFGRSFFQPSWEGGGVAKQQLLNPITLSRSLSQRQSKPITTTAFNSKRKFEVKEDRVVPMKKKAKLKNQAFNTDVELKDFTVDDEGYVVVYTDGACKANGRRGARAGIGVWFGDNHNMNISEPVAGNRKTNNTAEIQAAERAILKAKEAGINKLNIKTDSQFVINCVTKWVDNWRRKGWKLSDGNPVKNKDDLEKLTAAASDVHIKWSYVRGHKGYYGNEQADLLAVAGSEKSASL